MNTWHDAPICEDSHRTRSARLLSRISLPLIILSDDRTPSNSTTFCPPASQRSPLIQLAMALLFLMKRCVTPGIECIVQYGNAFGAGLYVAQGMTTGSPASKQALFFCTIESCNLPMLIAAISMIIIPHSSFCFIEICETNAEHGHVLVVVYGRL